MSTQEVCLGYPRQTTLCTKCKDTLTLCSDGKPYFRHTTNTLCEGDTYESTIHKYSKEIICAYLNDGYRLCIRSQCEKCHDTWNYSVQFPGIVYKEDIKYKSSIFDVAGLIDTQVVYGIEILHTFKTPCIEDRIEIGWFRVLATDVIAMNKKALTNNTLIDRRTICDSCGYIPTHLNKLARALGYLFTHDPYRCYGSTIMDMAMKGKCQVLVDYWSITYIKDKDLELQREQCWQLVMQKGVCLKCGERHKVIKYKPFCLSCYKSINSQYDQSILTGVDKFPEKNKKWVSITPEQQTILRDRIKWLDNIPDTVKSDTKCIDCGGIYRLIRRNTRYFGKYKKICEYCVNERMMKDGLIDLILNW